MKKIYLHCAVILISFLCYGQRTAEARLLDASATSGSNPIFLHNFNDMLFYSSSEMSAYEPYISDGTPQGTHILKDINSGAGGSIDYLIGSGYIAGGGPAYTNVTNQLFFKAYTPDSGFELFKTDGTEIGTKMVKDISGDLTNGLPEYTFMAPYNNLLLFAGFDPLHGLELWRSDGTETGTYLIKDINPGAGSAMHYENSNSSIPNGGIPFSKGRIKSYGILNGYFYFTATTNGDDFAIWKTDGTAEGTTLAMTLPAPEILIFPIRIIGSINDKLVISVNGQIFFSDGTQDGTTETEILAHDLTANYNGALYFFSNAGLYKTDGTVAGTSFVRATGYPKYLENNHTLIANGYLFFTTGNTSLWRTNGTEVGTIQLSEENTLDQIVDMVSINEKVFYIKIGTQNQICTTNGNISENFDFTISGFNAAYGITRISATSDKLFFNGSLSNGSKKLFALGMEELTLALANSYTNKSDESNVICYPNPSNGFVQIATRNNETVTSVEILDVSGKMILANNSYQNETIIDISGFSTGMYLVKVQYESQSETKKLFVK